MGEEFDESEVTFADVKACSKQENHIGWQQNKFFTKSKKKKMRHSVPLSIPENISSSRYVESDLFEDDYEDEVIVPPYILLRRRVLRSIAYSFWKGHGKTSKGREQNQIKNLIYRFTGYLET